MSWALTLFLFLVIAWLAMIHVQVNALSSEHAEDRAIQHAQNVELANAFNKLGDGMVELEKMNALLLNAVFGKKE